MQNKQFLGLELTFIKYSFVADNVKSAHNKYS